MTVNHWHIYEFMKNVYMRTGVIPTQEQIQQEFRGMPDEEVEEGMMEFFTTIRCEGSLINHFYSPING